MVKEARGERTSLAGKPEEEALRLLLQAQYWVGQGVARPEPQLQRLSSTGKQL